MKTKGLLLLVLQLCFVALSARAQFEVRFDQPRYLITRGQSLQVQVLIVPAPPAGLASFGVTVGFPGGNARVASASSILVPAAVDFNGVLGAGAVKAVGAGFAAVKGTVGFDSTPASYYRTGLLATITLQDLGLGPYTLSLSPFNTLGPTEEIFVNGTGAVLDPQITFGSAAVEYRVAPEPGTFAIFAGEPRQPAKSGVLYFKGNRNKVTGSIHSNSGIKLAGSGHVFRNGVVEYVTGIFPTNSFGGKVTFENSSLVRSTNKPYPVNYVLRDYAPGGRAAALAQAAGKYYRIRSRQTSLSGFVHNGVLREGLYYVEGDVDLDNDCIQQAHATIVATGRIGFNLKDTLFESYSDNLLAFTPENDCDSPSIRLSAKNNRWQGIVFAPNGLIEIHGQEQRDEWNDRDDDHDDHGEHRKGDDWFDDHRGGYDRDNYDPRGKDPHHNGWGHEGHDDDWRTENTTLLGALIGQRIRMNAKNFQVTALNTTAPTPQRLVSPLQCSMDKGELHLCFQAAAGTTYLIECADSLTRPDWKLWCVVEGKGGEISLKPPVGDEPQRFYRLRLE